MRARGCPVDTGPGELNIVYIGGMNLDGTLNDNALDKFNDLRIVIRSAAASSDIVGIWKATIDPGAPWVVNHPIGIGAAMIDYGYHTAWQVGIHLNNHEGLLQTGGPVRIWRDIHRTGKRNPGDPMQSGYFGINQHGTWQGMNAVLANVGAYSAGCLVAESMPEHREFMAAIKTDARYVKDHRFIFSTTVLSASEIPAV